LFWRDLEIPGRSRFQLDSQETANAAKRQNTFQTRAMIIILRHKSLQHHSEFPFECFGRGAILAIVSWEGIHGNFFF
jgi:hypothetical protein